MKKDECGVCGGRGINYRDGYCDCHLNRTDECGVCGGPGVPAGWSDCHTPPAPKEDNTHKVITEKEAKKRVEDNNGTFDGTMLRATLMWENCNDMDLWVFEPNKYEIWYENKRSPDGGFLDVDANAIECKTHSPVENF